VWATIIPLILSIIGDVVKAIFAQPKDQRVEYAKALRKVQDDHDKAWQKAQETGDTSDLEQLP